MREEEAHTATMVAPAAGATSRRSVASDGARMPRGSNAAESDDRPKGQCVVCGKGTYHQCIRPSPLAIDETHHAPLWLCFGCECPTCHTTTVRAPGSPTRFQYARPSTNSSSSTTDPVPVRKKRALPHPLWWHELHGRGSSCITTSSSSITTSSRSTTTSSTPNVAAGQPAPSLPDPLQVPAAAEQPAPSLPGTLEVPAAAEQPAPSLPGPLQVPEVPSQPTVDEQLCEIIGRLFNVRRRLQ